MTKVVAKKELRNFSYILAGGIFILFEVVPYLKGRGIHFYPIVISAILLLLGTFIPSSLEVLFKIWMGLGHVLGWINTRILLGLVFFLLITPAAVLKRLLGTKADKLSVEQKTFRIIRKAEDFSLKMEKPF